LLPFLQPGKPQSCEMVEGEREAFEQALAEKPLLRQQLGEVRVLQAGVEQAVLHQLMDQFHQSLPQEAEARPLWNWRWAAAAAVTLLALFGAWWWSQDNSPQQQLYAAYYEADPGLITPMSQSENYAFFRGMVDYKRGAYQAALDRWLSLRDDTRPQDTLNYFLGSALLAEGKEVEAIPYFQAVVADTALAFKEEAYWYLGLAFLKNGQAQVAREFLEKSDRPEVAALLKEMSNE
ncbi:MAG: hypothetical protein AAFP92_23265, partial [Bacteroidota bacterium]